MACHPWAFWIHVHEDLQYLQTLGVHRKHHEDFLMSARSEVGLR